MRVLTLNTGSSSLKAALYDMADGKAESRALTADMDRIGLSGGQFRIRDAAGRTLLEDERDLDDHAAVVRALFEWMAANGIGAFDAVGHRVVHGGPRFTAPQPVTPELMDELRRLVPFAPNHLPAAIAGIEAVSAATSRRPQFACFDTAFHRTMPSAAQMYALPRALADEGVLRYGFHGLSYEFIAGELARLGAGKGRAIVAHLGNGASITAMRDGVSVDTSMGFTPVAGLVMGTRTGDLDAGIVIYLMQAKGLSVAEVNDLINKQSGLLGVSGVSADMRDLLDRARTDPHADEAIEIFCRRAKYYVGAYTALLGGLDTLVFTAGIGENSPPIRARICAGLDTLGVAVDPARNPANAAVISPDGARVVVRVIKTDEDRVIARHVRALLAG